MKTIYRKTQYGILAILIVLISILITFGFYYQAGPNPLPLTPFIVIMSVFIVTILLFYKLEISIDNEKITAVFGIGLVKKNFLINEIDSIESYKIPWYVGIGIRITQRGTLWNVSTGRAVLINNKAKTKTFLVGSAEVDKIIRILKSN